MCAPSPPPAPDFAGAATAQGAANAETARIQSRANNANVWTPMGTQQVSWSGDQPEITQRYTPEYQRLFDNNRQLSEQMGLLGLGAADVAGQTMNQGLNFSGTPGMPGVYTPRDRPDALNPSSLPGLSRTTQPNALDPNSINRATSGDVLNPQNITAPGTAEQTRRSVIDAMMSRTNEDYSKQTDQTNSDLVAGGIMPGNKAYGDRMQMIERSRNDARQQAEIAGGNAAAQQFGMDLSRGNQQAALQGQQFGQIGQLSAQDAQLQGQQFGQALQGGNQNFGQQQAVRQSALGAQGQQFGQTQAALQAEQGQQQQSFGQSMDARRQAITELLAQRQTPLNEISAFRSGSQINPLTFSGVSPTQFAPPPYFGAAQAQGQADQNLYNAQAGQSNATMSGLFGLGAAGLGTYGTLAAAGMAF